MVKKAALEIQFETEIVSISDLKPHPDNYRSHPEDQIDEIIASIKEHGFYRNVVVARDGTILAGHGVVEAIKAMGTTRVPIVRLDIDADDPRAHKVLIGDNEIGHLGVRDDRTLTELLRGIRENKKSTLLGTGFTDQMLTALVFVTRHGDEIEDFDAAAHWVGMPDYEAKEKSIEIVVRFRSEEDKQKFAIKNEVTLRGQGKTVSCWWPNREYDDTSSVRYEQEAEA